MDANELPRVIEPDWYAEAVCATSDPELWFPESYRGGMPKGQVAKDICYNKCTVRLECLAAAMKEEENTQGPRFGIRGGLDGKERRQLRKRLTAYYKMKG